MSLFKNKFSSLSFMKKPDMTMIGQYPVNSLAFCKEENKDKPVIVFIGGAFQTFFSFKKEAQVLAEEFPVLLLDLPGQGSNTAICPELSFVDFAHILAKFTDHHQIKKIIPVGLSYGSGTAYSFASLYPNKVDSLIMGGTTLKVRESYRYLLEESLELMTASSSEELFCQGAVMNLINYSKRSVTQIPERIIKGFYKNMKGLSDNCRQRYIHNTKRLLDMQDLPEAPTCRALVFTGEYDNFTTPWENFQVAKGLPNSEFLLIKDGDHLANLEKRSVLIDVYQNFLHRGDWNKVEGIIYNEVQDFKDWDRRIEKRHAVETHQEATLIAQSGDRFDVKLRDINSHGLSFEFQSELIPEKSRSWYNIEIESEKELPLSGYLLDDGPYPRMIFRRGCFKGNDMLESFLSRPSL